MNPNIVKPLAALIVAALGVAGALGVPMPVDLGVIGEKIELVVAALLGGGLFVRQHWFFGKQSATKPVSKLQNYFS